MLTFNLGLISRYKQQLMGISTISIICCHAPSNGVLFPFPLDKIMALGQIGVIIFFFISGIGIHYSLSNSKPHLSLFAWYRRRLLRIFIPYLMLAIPYFLWYGVINEISLLSTLLTISTINYWICGKGAWFVAMILPYYLISPLIYVLYKKTKYYHSLVFLSFCALEYFSFYLLSYNSAIFQSSFFLLGFCVAPYVKNNTIIKGEWWLIVSILLWIVLGTYEIFSFIPRLWTLLPVFIIIPCWLLNRYGSFNLFSFMGRISLESYLTNVFFGAFIAYYSTLFIPNSLAVGYYLQYSLVVLFGLIISYASNKISSVIISKAS